MKWHKKLHSSCVCNSIHGFQVQRLAFYVLNETTYTLRLITYWQKVLYPLQEYF